MRQDSPDVQICLGVLQHLTTRLGQDSHPGAPLKPFLISLIEDLHIQWPALTRCELFLRDGGAYLRTAGFGIDAETPPTPAVDSAAARVIETRQPVLPDPDGAPVLWAVPLINADRLRGVLQLELPASEACQPTCKAALLTLSVLLDLAIERIETAPPARLLSILSDLSRQLGSTLVNAAAIREICERLVEAFNADYAAVVQFSPVTGGRLTAQHPAWLDPELVVAPSELGAYEYLTNYRAPLTVKLAETDETMLGPVIPPRLRAAGAQTVLIVPLLVHEEITGLLVLASVDRTELNQDELHAVQVLAAQLATSLQNADLFTEVQQRASQLERIATFGRLVTSTFDQHEIFEHVIEIVPNLLPTHQVNIMLYTPGHPQMRVITLAPDAAPAESRLSAAGSSVEQVVNSQSPMLIADLNGSNFTDHPRMAMQGLRSLLVAPLIASGHALGAVTVGHARPHNYSPTDLNLLQQVGNQIAVALENARLFQSTQERATYEEALGEITSHLQQQTDLRALLQQTMQDLGGVLGARRARVRLQIGETPKSEK